MKLSESRVLKRHVPMARHYGIQITSVNQIRLFIMNDVNTTAWANLTELYMESKIFGLNDTGYSYRIYLLLDTDEKPAHGY